MRVGLGTIRVRAVVRLVELVVFVARVRIGLMVLSGPSGTRPWRHKVDVLALASVGLGWLPVGTRAVSELATAAAKLRTRGLWNRFIETFVTCPAFQMVSPFISKITKRFT